MMSLTQEQVEAEARSLLEKLGPCGHSCELIPGRSMIGGGSLPEESLPTMLLALPPCDADAIAMQLRQGAPAVVARIQDGRVVLDLRTVSPGDVSHLAHRLEEVLAP